MFAKLIRAKVLQFCFETATKKENLCEYDTSDAMQQQPIWEASSYKRKTREQQEEKNWSTDSNRERNLCVACVR